MFSISCCGIIICTPLSAMLLQTFTFKKEMVNNIMDKIQAISALSLKPSVPVVEPRLGNLTCVDGGLQTRDNFYPVKNPDIYRMFLSTPISKKINSRSPEFYEAVNAGFARQQDVPVVLTLNRGNVIGLRDARKPFLSSLDILLNGAIPDDANVQLLITGIEIRVNNYFDFDARVDDPIMVGLSIVNNEYGKRPSFEFRTTLFRLACENGAIMEDDIFAGQFSGSKIDEFDTNLNDFVSDLSKSTKSIAGAVQRMVTTPIGNQFKSIHTSHQKLLDGAPYDPYTAKDNWWAAWNSITESAKISPNRVLLETMAGRLVEDFTRA